MTTYDQQAATAVAHGELIDLLNELYPEQSPDPRDPEREVWMKAGERRLVRKLNAMRDRGLKLRMP